MKYLISILGILLISNAMALESTPELNVAQKQKVDKIPLEVPKTEKANIESEPAEIRGTLACVAKPNPDDGFICYLYPDQ